MKKIQLLTLLCAALLQVPAAAQTATKAKVNEAPLFQQDEKAAEIQFDETTHDFGSFSEKDGVVKCTFTFTNKGDAPLVIHQAIASCGCTVPTYTKDPVKPGEKGTINVTYNGKGKRVGPFAKSITIKSNAKDTSIVRLIIKGNMTE